MHLSWMVGAIGFVALACGGRENGASAESVSTEQNATKTVSKTSVEAFQGGAESAELLLEQWYVDPSSEGTWTPDSIVLNADQIGRLLDCKTPDSQQDLETKQSDFLINLKAASAQREQALRDSAATQQLVRARSIRTVALSIGDELDGCVLKHPLHWHTVRSTVLTVDSTGQEEQEVHRCGMLEIGDRWFLKGVPGALMDSATRERDEPTIKPQSLQPQRPIRLDNKHRVRPSGP